MYGPDMRPVRIVCATRLTEDMFWKASFLGRSFLRIPEPLRPQMSVTFNNSGADAKGLSEVYNAAIDAANDDIDLALIHDDVYLNDWFFSLRVSEALEHYDVVSVAGSVNPDLAQPSWALRFDANLVSQGWQPGLTRSGSVNHFDHTCPNVSVYGPVPTACSLLDGMLIAIRTSVVKRERVRFDPRFRYHCYDLDFCRMAAKKGLKLGTWPIAVTHNSGGKYAEDQFKRTAHLYLEKWATIRD
jgi:GT2 family glycosyltransferase